MKRCSSNLASGLYITKDAKWHLSCCCHDNSYAASPVVIETIIPRFYPKQESSTHNNLVGIVKAIWEPFVCPARPSVPLKKIANGHVWFSTEKDWSRKCCHGNNIVVVSFCSFVMSVSNAKYEEHCSNISGDILDWVLYCFNGPPMTSPLSHLHKTKT